MTEDGIIRMRHDQNHLTLMKCLTIRPFADGPRALDCFDRIIIRYHRNPSRRSDDPEEIAGPGKALQRIPNGYLGPRDGYAG